MSDKWEGHERRSNIITLETIELVMRKYLDEYRNGLEKMCDTNVTTGFLKHNAEKVHFDKEEKRQIHETINFVKDKKRMKWGFWIPVCLVSIAALFNIFTLFVKIKL